LRSEAGYEESLWPLWQPAQKNTVLSPKPIHFGH
jgi:hypothetical protein